MEREITKIFSVTLFSLFIGNIYRLLRKRIFLYLIASFLFASSFSLINYEEFRIKVILFSLARIFPVIVFLAFIITMIGNIIVAHINGYTKFTAIFSERDILVCKQNQYRFEHKGWQWIKSYSVTKNFLFLDAGERTKRVMLVLYKNKIPESELEFLKEWLKRDRSRIDRSKVDKSKADKTNEDDAVFTYLLANKRKRIK